MNRRNTISLLLLIGLATGIHCFADEEPLSQQIQRWVQQLGDESFLVRQRAESLLIRTGIQAYPELQRAKQNPDMEIVRRAEYVLSQIEQAFLDMENREAAAWIHTYMLDPNPAAKARTIWYFADARPTSDLARGEGLQTLCRLVRFEEDSALRLEAAKTLIASPPLSPAAQQKWYQYIRDNIHSIGDNELLQCVANYAKLWCDLDESDEKTTAAFQERVRQVGTETLRLLERPENRIQVGSKIDIMLHYAVAELQDAAGLLEDRDKTAALALAIESEPIQTLEQVMQIDHDDDLSMIEHYRTGRYLNYRYRIHWAIAHFQKVIETEETPLRIQASREAAKSAIFLEDYPTTIAFIDKHIEILKDSGHLRNDTESLIFQAQRLRDCCVAEQAVAEKNWEAAREAIMRAWTTEPPNNHDSLGDGEDVALSIAAHQLCKQFSGIDNEFKEKMKSELGKTWGNIMSGYDGSASELRTLKVLNACNAGAWLLANTDGDYPSALILIEAAMKIEPDDLSIQDTLAHVYFLGGRVEDAIRVQAQVVRLAPESILFLRALERFKRGKSGE